MLLAAAAPFEQLDPPSVWIFRISSVEILILFMLACTLVRFFLGGPSWRFRSKVSLPAVLLAGAFFLASFFAPLPGEALRQSARLAVGVLLFFIAFNFLRDGNWQRRFVLAVFVSGTIVACLGVLESLSIEFVTSLLHAFKTAPFQVGGWVRASSTLQYPTIAAMYLEMVFALGIGLLIDLASQRKQVFSILVLLALVLVAQGIFATLTRSGLALLFLVSTGALIVVWVRQGINRVFASVGAVLGIVSLLTLLNVGTNPGLTLRLKNSDQREWFRARLTVLNLPNFRTSGEVTVEVLAENLGIATWDSSKGFYVSYHWLAPDEDDVEEFDGVRTPFPGPVAPGRRVRIPVRVRAPSEPGRYRLAFDVLKENQFWFSAMGSDLPTKLVTVAGQGVTSDLRKASLPDPLFKVDRLSLWRIASRIIITHPILGIGPGSFEHVYGRYLGLDRWDEHTHTNSLYLEIPVGTGIVGAIPFALLVWACFVLSLQSLKPLQKGPVNGLSVGLGLAVLAFLAHGVVDYFLGFTPIYVIFWLTLGLLAVRIQNEGEVDAHSV